MPIHITVDRAADWVANQLLIYREPQITEDRKKQILPAEKYNVLVSVFNASTVLLVIAVASAIFFAYNAAFVLGSVALFERLTTEKELNKYALPIEPQEKVLTNADRIIRNAVAQIHFLCHALHQAPQREREDNIFQRLGLTRPQDWIENEMLVFDYAMWKNKVPIPETKASSIPIALSS